MVAYCKCEFTDADGTKVPGEPCEIHPKGQTAVTEQEHTSGPWNVEHADENVFDIVPDDNIGGTIAIAYDEGNARLIAAAPELKDALVELLAAELAIFPSAEAGKEAQDAWADRRATARNNASFVIAKATGR